MRATPLTMSAVAARTIDNRKSTAPRELLPAYGDLVSWSVQTGVLSPSQAGRLLASAKRSPGGARRALARAHSLRESLFAIFIAAAERRPAPPRALRALETELKGAFAGPSLVSLKAYQLAWRDRETALDRMLGPVIRSAVELLTSPALDRVRMCAAGGCGWLFFDESRNRSRQWCDMTVCGNRVKARRFYERKRRLARRRTRRASTGR